MPALPASLKCITSIQTAIRIRNMRLWNGRFIVNGCFKPRGHCISQHPDGFFGGIALRYAAR
jgi:hypothetical protein